MLRRNNRSSSDKQSKRLELADQGLLLLVYQNVSKYQFFYRNPNGEVSL